MPIRLPWAVVLVASIVVSFAAIADDEPTERRERPDLDGVWDFRTATPLERPPALADKPVFSDAEAAVFEQQVIERRAASQRKYPSVHAPSDLDYGTDVQPNRRTSLVVEPADGRVPARTGRSKALQAARRKLLERPAHGPEDRSLWERCLMGFNAGPPMNPGAYNNNLRIIATADHVVLVNEMVHDARIVPLDGRARLPASIRHWQGESRGRWQGDTLVVETTNFTAQTSFIGSGENLHLEERFTRIDEGTLLYAYTVDDPESFEAPWSAEIVMTRGGPMYEYACHEGNYALLHMLQAARALDGGEAPREQP